MRPVVQGSDAGDAPAVQAAPAGKPEDAWKQSYNVAEAEKEEQILGARTLEDFLSGTVKFYGRPISIQVNEANVQDVINFIADESGVNIVISEDVQGRISLKLRQIPWDQALVIVMRTKGLGYVRQGNVIRITRLETLQAETRAAKDIVDAQTRLTPVRVKVIPVSYATVGEMATQIQPFLSADRGRVVSDPRTSSLIVTDTAEVLARIERLVKELDLPPTQVMIEGKIVEASESFSRTLGVNWGFSGVPLQISGGGGFSGSPVNMLTTFGSSTVTSAVLGGQSASLNLNIGTLDFFGNLNARLGLAQAETMVKVISSPRIVTMNRAPAQISQKGEVISVTRTRDATGAETATPVRTGVDLSLNVTPQITADGSVILDVDVKRQFAGAVAEELTQTRPVNTREAKTKILVPNGQTAVIGGIYQNDETESERGVPWLKEIPVFGWLFKSNIKDRNKNELLIFLTPRVLNAQEQSTAN
jgi:type IV pilus assembly protein PilQ